jgi:hypothetical protein
LTRVEHITASFKLKGDAGKYIGRLLVPAVMLFVVAVTLFVAAVVLFFLVAMLSSPVEGVSDLRRARAWRDRPDARPD